MLLTERLYLSFTVFKKWLIHSLYKYGFGIRLHSLFIGRQHADSAILIIHFYPSVCMFVWCWYCVDGCTNRPSCFRHSVSIILVFWTHLTLQNSKCNPLSGALKTPGAFFDRNRRLSWKRYEIFPYLLWTNGKSYIDARSITVSSDDVGRSWKEWRHFLPADRRSYASIVFEQRSNLAW